MTTPVAAALKTNILLVDDQPSNLLALDSMLECLGQNLIQARSGEEALRQLLEADFAVVILDVRMPTMSGLELAAMIRQHERLRDTPIIFVTAGGRNEDQMFKGYAVGAADYILKPIIPEILKAKVAVFIDLFKKKRELQEQKAALSQAVAELKRSNADLEQFAFVAAHDLQEPMRTVAGYMGLLVRQAGESLSPEAKGLIAHATDAAARMQARIQDLLSYARLGAGRPAFGAVDCEELFKSVLSQLRQTIKESGAAVTHDPLPTVLGDAPQLSQLFQNLIGNAIKFRAAQTPEVHLGVRKDERGWVFSVRDNGIGIDPAQTPRLFRIFQRLHAAHEYPGTGIGLAISRKIVERHGGGIWVESAPAKGSTFYFNLPDGEDGHESPPDGGGT